MAKFVIGKDSYFRHSSMNIMLHNLVNLEDIGVDYLDNIDFKMKNLKSNFDEYLVRVIKLIAVISW